MAAGGGAGPAGGDAGGAAGPRRVYAAGPAAARAQLLRGPGESSEGEEEGAGGAFDGLRVPSKPVSELVVLGCLRCFVGRLPYLPHAAVGTYARRGNFWLPCRFCFWRWMAAVPGARATPAAQQQTLAALTAMIVPAAGGMR